MSVQILVGDCRETLKTLASESVQTCVTSPPYWGQRDYGHEGQLGQEATPGQYVQTLVGVFSEIWRVLKPDATLFLNLGDSYCSQGGIHDGRADNQPGVGAARQWRNGSGRADGIVDERGQRNRNGNTVPGMKPKDLIGIPWRVAFAMQDAGWYLRSEITWCKRAPMPESVKDRPTSATEKIFLFTKSPTYLYNADAVRLESLDAVDDERRIAAQRNGNKSAPTDMQNGLRPRGKKPHGHPREQEGWLDAGTKAEQCANGANLRNFWVLGPESFADAHFATFPTEIPRRAILIGSRPGDTILDPFGGSGTTGMVALELGRKAVLCELNPAYVALIEQRCHTTPGLAL